MTNALQLFISIQMIKNTINLSFLSNFRFLGYFTENENAKDLHFKEGAFYQKVISILPAVKT